MNTRVTTIAALGLALSACQTNQANNGYTPNNPGNQATTPTVSVAEAGEGSGRTLTPNLIVSGQGESNVAGVSATHIANEHYRRGRAGDTDAQYQLAHMYLHGLEGVPQNATLGNEWLKRAAASSHPGALYDLGFEQLSNNPQAAVDYFSRAGLQGNVDAQSTLGAMFSSGTQVKENATAAYAWYSLANDQANAAEVAKRLKPAEKNVANNMLQNYRSQVRVNLANAERRRAAMPK